MHLGVHNIYICPFVDFSLVWPKTHLFGDALSLEVLGVLVGDAAGVDPTHLFYQVSREEDARPTRSDDSCGRKCHQC